MKKLIFLSFALVLTCDALKAQLITPTNLLQIYKYTLLREDQFGKSAYQYIRSMDDGWNLGGKPDIDNQGVTVLYNFSSDHKGWYHPEIYHLMIVQQYGPSEKRSVLYRFSESGTWASYNQQMISMNAVKLDTRASQGGQQTIYTLNDITFILTDFPPGINGDSRTYQVAITHNIP